MRLQTRRSIRRMRTCLKPSSIWPGVPGLRSRGPRPPDPRTSRSFRFCRLCRRPRGAWAKCVGARGKGVDASAKGAGAWGKGVLAVPQPVEASCAQLPPFFHRAAGAQPRRKPISNHHLRLLLSRNSKLRCCAPLRAGASGKGAGALGLRHSRRAPAGGRELRATSPFFGHASRAQQRLNPFTRHDFCPSFPASPRLRGCALLRNHE